MFKMNRSTSAVLTSALLLGGLGWVASPSAQAQPKPAAAAPTTRPHVQLREADHALSEAETFLKEAPENYPENKAMALKRINEARVEISLILSAEKKAAATQPSGPGPVPPAPTVPAPKK